MKPSFIKSHTSASTLSEFLSASESHAETVFLCFSAWDSEGYADPCPQLSAATGIEARRLNDIRTGWGKGPSIHEAREIARATMDLCRGFPHPARIRLNAYADFRGSVTHLAVSGSRADTYAASSSMLRPAFSSEIVIGHEVKGMAKPWKLTGISPDGRALLKPASVKRSKSKR